MAKGVRKPGKLQINKLLHSAIENLNLGVTITDLDGKILYTNPAEARMHGYFVEDLIGKDARIFAPRDLWKGISPEQVKQISSWSRESVNIRQDGTIFPVQIVSDLILDPSGAPHGVITLCEDITEKRSSYAAFYDPLTDLPNRMLFMDRLGRSVKRTKRRTDYIFAVIYADLDRFKSINDSCGYETGDRLLVACSRRIESCLRFGDTVAHVGGDEFAILLEDIRTAKDATFVAERIQQHLELPFNINNQDLSVSASMGIAKGSSGYDRPEDLLRDANIAMYRAKILGRNRYEVFDHTMQTRAMALLPLELSLRRAIEKNEMQLVYQPVYSIDSQKLEACEVFLRWHHPERGIVDPEDFVPVAEEIGVMAAVGEWLLRTACKQVKAWQEKTPDLKLLISVTTAQLEQNNWIRVLTQILEDTGLDPGSLELLISETTLMRDGDKILPLLNEIRKRRMHVSIRDYGTGHSSLEYLKRFEINSLKLDRGFLHDMIRNRMEESVGVAMITLAHSARIRVIADGVENDEQLSFLKWHHCDAALGNLFSPPLSADEFTKLLF
jgi:diguanylate cyclase (GGDEF)-like protein/PAS domain S-box-containing protein